MFYQRFDLMPVVNMSNTKTLNLEFLQHNKGIYDLQLEVKNNLKTIVVSL